MNVNALVRAFEIASQQNLKPVLDIFQICLGQMLINAASLGNDACVKELIDAGADVNFVEENCLGKADLALSLHAIQYYTTHFTYIPPFSEVILWEAYKNLNCANCLDVDEESVHDENFLKTLASIRDYSFSCSCNNPKGELRQDIVVCRCTCLHRRREKNWLRPHSPDSTSSCLDPRRS